LPSAMTSGCLWPDAPWRIRYVVVCPARIAALNSQLARCVVATHGRLAYNGMSPVMEDEPTTNRGQSRRIDRTGRRDGKYRCDIVVAAKPRSSRVPAGDMTAPTQVVREALGSGGLGMGEGLKGR
jgi:hypothetical protein